MLSSILGKKVGMTQLFNQKGEVVPVTVIDIANWVVTQKKNEQKDGYTALQVGLLKKKYCGQPFDLNWCKNKKKYFVCLREIKVDDDSLQNIKTGQEIKVEDLDLQAESLVKVTGKSIGLGFQGVVKRWGFGGGPASHGSTFHRKPGAVGNMRTQGEVVKGKKLPGQCGSKRITIKGLKVVSLDKDSGHLFIKGAVPGKKDSLLFISKQG